MMAKARSKRLRSEKKKRPTKPQQHPGQLPSPPVSPISRKITHLLCNLLLSNYHLRRSSVIALRQRTRSRSQKRHKRTRTKRLRRPERSLSLKPYPSNSRQYSCHTGGPQQQSTIQPPTNVMPNDLDPRGTSNKTVYRHLGLIDIINKVEVEEKDRDRLHGLVTCAEEFKRSQNKNCKCNSITSLGWSKISFILSPSYLTVTVFKLQYLECLFHLHLKHLVKTTMPHQVFVPISRYTLPFLEVYLINGTGFKRWGKISQYIYSRVPSIAFELKNSHFIMSSPIS